MLVQNFTRSISGLAQTSDKGQSGMNENFLNSMASGTVSAKYSRNGNYMNFLVGSGDTEPAVTDIALTDDKSLVLTFVSGSCSRCLNNGTTIGMINAVYKNNTSSPITIKEVALARNLSSYFSRDECYLYSHTLLDTPVTIGVGESYSFTYMIELV